MSTQAERASPERSIPRRLRVVYDRIGARAAAISEGSPEWPCRRGCDDCCRRLADLPVATRVEWEGLWSAFAGLAPEVRRSVRARADALVRAAADATGPIGPVICPFLDTEAGSCLVYEGRLGACRMHGFYAARDGGRWCERIEALATTPAGAAVIWGNYDAVDRDLQAAGGAPISLAAWLRDHAAPEGDGASASAARRSTPD